MDNKYYIALAGVVPIYRKVAGEPVSSDTPFALFIRHNINWEVSEITTGTFVSIHPNKDRAIKIAIERMTEDPLYTAERIGELQSKGWISPLIVEPCKQERNDHEQGEESSHE